MVSTCVPAIPGAGIVASTDLKIADHNQRRPVEVGQVVWVWELSI
jgi:hypothetical protein